MIAQSWWTKSFFGHQWRSVVFFRRGKKKDKKNIPNLLIGPWNLLTPPLWMSLQRLQRFPKKPLWDLANVSCILTDGCRLSAPSQDAGWSPPRWHYMFRFGDSNLNLHFPAWLGRTTQYIAMSHTTSSYFWCWTSWAITDQEGKTLLINISSTWWFHCLVDKLTRGRWRQDEFVVVSLQKTKHFTDS